MPSGRRGASRRPPAGAATRWEAYAASAIGADHVRRGAPNQDAVAATRFGGRRADDLVVLAVSDGHGNPRHFRSDRGARLAVSAGVAAAADWAAGLPAGVMPSREAASRFVVDVVARWRDAVGADLARDPVAAAQAAALVPGDPPEVPYGATLLLAAVRADVAVLAQIGDGDILLVRHDGEFLAPVPGDQQLDGTQTTSLCQPDAVSAFRVARVSLARTPVYAIFAATDGYGNAQAAADWKAIWARDLVGLGGTRGARWIGQQLESWVTICASADGSGDDTTAALALNPAATLIRPASPAPPGDQLANAPRAPWLPRTTGTRLSLIGVVAAACAVAVYLLVSSPSRAPARPVPFPTPIRPAACAHTLKRACSELNPPSPNPRPRVNAARSDAQK